MDINYNKSRNNSWDLDMTMDTPILHDQHPYNLDYLDFPLQTHQILSTQIPNLSPLTHREEVEEQEEQLGPIKEMMYKIAAMQPVDIDLATIRKPKRRNVRISDDPQSVAARQRRERISEKIRILQRLVPGGTKMDTATMLDEAICYVKFLKRQVHKLQSNQESPCIGLTPNSTAGDWAFLSNNALGSTSSSSIERSAGAGFTFGGSDIPCDGLYFTSERIKISHIYREGNKAADALARLASSSLSSEFYNGSNIPRSVKGQAFVDKLGIGSFKGSIY